MNRGDHTHTATAITQTLLKLSGLISIILGIARLDGYALALIHVHMLVGFVLVLSLWTLAGLAAAAGVHWGLVTLAIIWGLIVLTLGLTQTQLLPGSAHWVIEVLHLLIGLAAIGREFQVGKGLPTSAKNRAGGNSGAGLCVSGRTENSSAAAVGRQSFGDMIHSARKMAGFSIRDPWRFRTSAYDSAAPCA